MNENYIKVQYDGPQGFNLHHTLGAEASNSTLGYPHCSTAYMLIHFIHGTGRIKIEGRHYDICEGDIILLNPKELFHCQVDQNIFHERIVLHLTDSLLCAFPGATVDLFQPFTDREKGIGNRISAEAVRSAGLDSLLTTLLKLFQSPAPSSKLLSICKMVELLIQLRQTAAHDHSEYTHSHESPLIEEILIYINAHFREEISIDHIAQAFNLHKSYLSHLFTEHVGMALWNYVILRRLNAFNDLVRSGSAIEEACYEVGFRNYSNFFRLYKKHTGMTPMQYKKQLTE